MWAVLASLVAVCTAQTLTIPLEHRGSRLSVGELRHRITRLQDADSLDDDALALLQNVKSLQYIGELYFGDSETKSKCIYDSGSSNTWSYTSQCTTTACKNHNRIDVSGRSAETEIEIEYGSGSIRGLLLHDTISFEKCGGKCSDSPKCHCAPTGDWIGVTETTGQAFDFGEFNCILGLAHPRLAADNTKMSLVAMMESNRIANNMFGFYLTKTADSAGSRFTIGDPDKQLYTGSMTFHDLYYPGQSAPSYWTVKLSRVSLKYPDGTVVDTGHCKGGCEMALDSGTSLFTGPQNMVYPLIEKLNVQEDCTNAKQLPTIGFTVENPQMTYWITPESYVYKEKADGADVCIGSFFPLDVPSHESLWIAGDSFLSSYYSVYDFSCWQSGKPCKAGLAAKASIGGVAGAGPDTGFTTITSGDVTELYPPVNDAVSGELKAAPSTATPPKSQAITSKDAVSSSKPTEEAKKEAQSKAPEPKPLTASSKDAEVATKKSPDSGSAVEAAPSESAPKVEKSEKKSEKKSGVVLDFGFGAEPIETTSSPTSTVSKGASSQGVLLDLGSDLY